MAEMKRPKRKKYPTWPKAPKSKTLQALERYEARVKAVKAKRDAIDREFEAQMKKYKAQEKRKSSVIAGIGKLKGN